ncbi:hypothetical protein [Domibacillus aminovorans]|uniref:hypothetical protein n=1 Tax=Domibacillus aminovorans TaxID=29332 RepID=UPI0012FD34AF|nr:hypothetical protein [Domibacillus aminovorans]
MPKKSVCDESKFARAVIEAKVELTELGLQDKSLINSMISETEFVICGRIIV